MDQDDKKCCLHCKYFCTTEEYWHDHYLIRSHQYCSYHSKYNEYEVESDHCCKHFVARNNIRRDQ